MPKGLVIVYTGDGKGKTSAALGIALRSCGHALSVSMVQFVKSPTDSGEELAAERLKPHFELITTGKGFVNIPGHTATLPEHEQAAEEAFILAQQRILSGYWDVVILDEINVAVKLGLLDIAKVLDLVRKKPNNLHVVLTGRDAHEDLISLADLVTEMRLVKHPYDESGIPAQKGIDF
jgi:cob(I)alamin adenosyltransferase